MWGLYVDTGVWLALLDEADSLHGRAKSVIETHRDWSFVSAELVLSETVALVRRQRGSRPAAGFGREFIDGKVGGLVRSEPVDWREGLRIIEKYREQKISFADATSVAVTGSLARTLTRDPRGPRHIVRATTSERRQVDVVGRCVAELVRVVTVYVVE